MKNLLLITFLLLICKITLSQVDSLQSNIVYKEFKYPNGKISSKGYLEENKPTGFWISYYLTGVKKSEGKWTNSKLDSIWTFYDMIGDTTEKINYYLGKKNGYHYRFFKKDNSKKQILSKELYVNGKRNDKSHFYFKNGEIKKVIPYLNDKKQGIGFEYDKNGLIITITRYRNNEIIVQENINRINDNGSKEGVWKEFYRTGILKEEETYLDGKLNGYVKLYNEEGKLVESIKYNNGEVSLDSNDFDSNIEIKEEFDINENLIFSGSFKNDIPIGVHRYFDSNGKVKSSKTYDFFGKMKADGIVFENGKEDGDWIYYHENEKKKAVGKYRNGKKQGSWKYYYPNGRIQQSGSYVTGKLSGIWKWYYETGELLMEESYIYGRQDGESIEYSVLGEIISKGNYIEGYKEGEWIFVVGDQRHIGKFVMDMKNGEWKSYYIEEQTPSFEGRYVQGNPDGKHEFFHNNGMIKEDRFYSEGQKVKSWSKYDEYGDLIIVIQYKEGKPYKINGVKVKLDQEDN
ncbi:MAG: hypothetical protein KAR57_06895 [Bacteroidales bacterium]|nr:hypothetical protein [Bacteroidales bacterium]